MDISSVIAQLVNRKKAIHKGECGRLAVIAGSSTMEGAGVLVARSAFRTGAGLVYLCSSINLETVLKTVPEVMCLPVRFSADLIVDCVTKFQEKQINVLAIGPGCGQSKTFVDFFRMMIQDPWLQSVPMVIDADGLNALTLKELTLLPKNSCILTPHVGEFKRLFPSLSNIISNEDSDRVQVTKKAALLSGQVVVLKGPNTVVASTQEVYVNTTGNEAMATAGIGDVLTGVIASFLGQGLSLFQAASAGVYVHGCAADRLRKRLSIGLMASDLVEELPHVLVDYE